MTTTAQIVLVAPIKAQNTPAICTTCHSCQKPKEPGKECTHCEVCKCGHKLQEHDEYGCLYASCRNTCPRVPRKYRDRKGTEHTRTI